MRKRISFIFIMVCVMVFCGCSVETVEEHDNRISQEEAIVSSSDKTTQDDLHSDISATKNETTKKKNKTERSTSEKEVTSRTAEATSTDDSVQQKSESVKNQTIEKTSYKGEDTVKTESITTAQSVTKKTVKQTTKTEVVKSTSKTEAISTTKSTTKATVKTTTKVTTKPVEITTTIKPTETTTYSQISVSISLSEIGQGNVLTNYKMNVDSASAFDVIKTACQQNGIQFDYESSAFGLYIKGINGVSEKDYGVMSGWMYKINGTTPNRSADKYQVFAGDNVEFYYTK